jgi:hypothetical protein
MRRYRSSAPPSTIWSVRDSCWRGAFQQRVFWWRHCSKRGADDDVAEAEAAIERLAAAPTDEGLVLRDRFDHLRRKPERRRRRQKRSRRVG